MNRTTTLLALAAGTTALLTACGSGATSVPVAPVAAPQAGPTSVAAPAAPRPAPVSDPGATIDADDQSGDGTTVVVRDVRLTGGPGWVVVRTDDRDRPVLGSVAVPAGQAGPVTVTLTEPVPTTGDDDDDLTAVLHLDDGDGVFDESRDAAVLDEDDDDDDDDDGDDIEDDDFDYRVA